MKETIKPRKRLAPLYLDGDKKTFKVFSGEEILRLAYGFEDFLTGCGMGKGSASFHRCVATRFAHFLENEGRRPDDIKAASDFLAQLNVKNLSYRSSLKWFYVFLEKQGMTKIHPLGNLAVNLSYLRKATPAVGKDSFLSPHNIELSVQTQKIYQRDREIEFLRDEILKAKKAMRYKDRVMQDILDAWEDSNLYNRPITAGEARQHFNLLQGAINYRGPAYIDKPSGRGNVQTLESEDSKGRASEGLRAVGDARPAGKQERPTDEP